MLLRYLQLNMINFKNSVEHIIFKYLVLW